MSASWRFEEQNDDIVIWGDDEASKQGFPIARLDCLEREQDEELANARLITAAPDLLEALKRLLETPAPDSGHQVREKYVKDAESWRIARQHAREVIATVERIVEIDEETYAAEKAIAKATGKEKGVSDE